MLSRKMRIALAGVAQLIGALSCTLKVGGLIPSGHIPSLWVGVCMGGNQSMFLSHIDVSLSLSNQLTFFKKKMRMEKEYEKMRTYLGELQWGWFFAKQRKGDSEGGVAGDPYWESKIG